MARPCKSSWHGLQGNREPRTRCSQRNRTLRHSLDDSMRARSLTKRAAQSAKNADTAEAAAGWMANAALREAEVGNSAQARELAADTLDLSRGSDVAVQVALALARAGQAAQAEKIAATLDTERPRSTMVQNYWLPTIRAAIELQNKNPNKALELLDETTPYELGVAFARTYVPCLSSRRGLSEVRARARGCRESFRRSWIIAVWW